VKLNDNGDYQYGISGAYHYGVVDSSKICISNPVPPTIIVRDNTLVLMTAQDTIDGYLITSNGPTDLTQDMYD
jgi:hypothetical protein